MQSRPSVRRERRCFRPLRLEPLEQLVLPGFLAPLAFDSGPNPYSVAVGDFNGDGIPDLALANAESNTVSVLLGNGDGTFLPAQSYPAGSSPTSVAVGDFNGDGIQDLAVANYDGVSVLLGKGDGTFLPAVGYYAGLDPLSVAVGDFNGDGTPDLAVANYFSNSVRVLLGNGDGSFRDAHYTTPIRMGPLSIQALCGWVSTTPYPYRPTATACS
jgi:hypothetical protein